MLAVSVTLMIASAGLSWLTAALWVLHAAWRTGTGADRAPGPVPGLIVVLGHRLRRDGAPSHAFHTRLQRAAALWRAAAGQRILLLGGVNRPGWPAEAQVGRAALLAQGLPGECIGTEMRSRHTLENLRGLRATLATGTMAPPILVTSRPHLARALLMARGMGISAEPCAAEARLDGTGILTVPSEAFLLHWYVTGRLAAWLLRSRRLAARIT